MIIMPPTERVNVGEVTLSVHVAGPKPSETTKPTLVFIHGFPETAFSWRHQLQHFADLGYPVLAPDGRGFGASDAPKGVAEYTMAKLTGDYAGLLDHYGVDRAVFIAHDWGALVMWQMPFYQPGRALGYAALNIPLMPPYPMDPIELLRMRFGADCYMVRFQEADAPEKILEADIARTFRFFMRKPGKPVAGDIVIPLDKAAHDLDLLGLLEGPDENWGGQQLLTEEEVAVYAAAYAKSGFTGGINYYRNMSANRVDQKRFLDEKGRLPIVQEPCLMMPGEVDRACPPVVSDTMGPMCANFERHDLKGVGHWSAQEAPDEVNARLADWLTRHGW